MHWATEVTPAIGAARRRAGGPALCPSCPRHLARPVLGAPRPALASPGTGRCGRAIPPLRLPGWGRQRGKRDGAGAQRGKDAALPRPAQDLCAQAHSGRYSQGLPALKSEGTLDKILRLSVSRLCQLFS